MRLHPGPPAVWRQKTNLLAQGQRAFETGRFDEAQTWWEAEALGASGEIRATIEGLVTVAAGMLELEEQRPRTAERLLARGRRLLAAGRQRLEGADVGAVRAAADVVVTALRRGDPTSAHVAR